MESLPLRNTSVHTESMIFTALDCDESSIALPFSIPVKIKTILNFLFDTQRRIQTNILSYVFEAKSWYLDPNIINEIIV